MKENLWNRTEGIIATLSLNFLPFFLCVHVSVVRVCTVAYVWAMCKCKWARVCGSSSLFIKAGSQSNPEPEEVTSVIGCSGNPLAIAAEHPCLPGIYLGSRDLNSGLQTSMATPLTSVPSPQSCDSVL